MKRILALEGRVFIEVPDRRSLRARPALPARSRRLRVDERFRAYPIHLPCYNVRTLPWVLAAHCGWTVEASLTLGMSLDEY